MREFLVTKFICGGCGSLMELSYDKPPVANHFAHGEPTGALMLSNIIVLKPCQKCLAPLREMKDAVNILIGRKETT